MNNNKSLRNIYIYDLDGTLYLDSKQNFKKDLYSQLKKQNFKKLIDSLKKLKNNYIFTNANFYHASESLKNMGISFSHRSIIDCLGTDQDIKSYYDGNKIPRIPVIKNITSSDIFFGGLKPDYYPYLVTKNNFKIRDNHDKIIFFENTIENLETAHFLGWITVYIKDGKPIPTRNRRKPYYVNHVYNTLQEALDDEIENKAISRINGPFSSLYESTNK